MSGPVDAGPPLDRAALRTLLRDAAGELHDALNAAHDDGVDDATVLAEVHRRVDAAVKTIRDVRRLHPRASTRRVVHTAVRTAVDVALHRAGLVGREAYVDPYHGGRQIEVAFDVSQVADENVTEFAAALPALGARAADDRLADGGDLRVLTVCAAGAELR